MDISIGAAHNPYVSPLSRPDMAAHPSAADAAGAVSPSASALPPVPSSGSADSSGSANTRDKGGSPVEAAAKNAEGCQTCKNRKYQDGSNDAGVSYKSPTQIDPQAVAGAVRGHEMEHVYRERFKAEAEGRRILFQSVTMHTGICGECGRVYISGGTTRTVSRSAQAAGQFQVGLPDNSAEGGFSAKA